MIATLLHIIAKRLGVSVESAGPFVEVPREVTEQLLRRPGSRLRARFDVVVPVETETTVYSIVEEPAGIQ